MNIEKIKSEVSKMIDALSVEELKISDNYFIVRGDRSGVFAGEIIDRVGREVTLNNCRRLWYWNGAASLSQMAVDGVSKPTECKFSVATNGHLVLDALEVIPCTEKAQKSIKGVSIWKV